MACCLLVSVRTTAVQMALLQLVFDAPALSPGSQVQNAVSQSVLSRQEAAHN